MSDAWYYADGTNKVGPVSLADLSQALAKRQNPKDFRTGCASRTCLNSERNYHLRYRLTLSLNGKCRGGGMWWPFVWALRSEIESVEPRWVEYLRSACRQGERGSHEPRIRSWVRAALYSCNGQTIIGSEPARLPYVLRLCDLDSI